MTHDFWCICSVSLLFSHVYNIRLFNRVNRGGSGKNVWSKSFGIGLQTDVFSCQEWKNQKLEEFLCWMFCRNLLCVCVHLKGPPAVSSFLKPKKNIHPFALWWNTKPITVTFFFGGGTISIQWWDDPKIFELKKPTSEIGSSVYKRIFFELHI